MRRACKYLTHQTVHDVTKLHAVLCRNKSSNCLKEMSSSLQKWHDVVAAVPTSTILPSGFGNKSGAELKHAAWYGDKLIGEQVAWQLNKFLSSMNTQKHKNIRRGMFLLHNVAVSNRLFADKLQVILPLQSPKNIAIVSLKKVHDAGTMIEAAVHAVSNLPASKKHEAIATLAKFLIVQAAQESETLPRESNEKLLKFMKVDCIESIETKKQKASAIFAVNVPSSVIIEAISEDRALFVLNKYGGKVHCIDLSKHPPTFRATAVLNGSVVSSEASRKKSAKRHAAYTLLMKMKKAHNL